MIEIHIKQYPFDNKVTETSGADLLAKPEDSVEVVFEGDENWRSMRPSTLVVACSDGRLQKSIDEFLERNLGVVDYDRLYAPGGPAMLGSGTSEVKTDQIRRELKFLMEAHRIEEIVLLFHGADRSGPEDAMCAHYRRVLPNASRAQIARQQLDDAGEAIRVIADIAPRIRIHVFRAEVRSSGSVHFVDLTRK